eukprot:COSAG05_NODE_23095_length_260_cov_0.645963_1_plen_51_part_01
MRVHVLQHIEMSSGGSERWTGAAEAAWAGAVTVESDDDDDESGGRLHYPVL